MTLPEPKLSLYGDILTQISKYMAIAGSLILCAMGLMVVVSVIGRNLFLLPIPGDFEIVAMSTAAAVFLCLPYCHLREGNIKVDFFLANAPRQIRGTLDALSAVVFAALATVFTWRMILGLIGFYRNQDISQILAIPLWWVFPFAIASFAMLTLNCLYMSGLHLKQDQT